MVKEVRKEIRELSLMKVKQIEQKHKAARNSESRYENAKWTEQSIRENEKRATKEASGQ